MMHVRVARGSMSGAPPTDGGGSVMVPGRMMKRRETERESKRGGGERESGRERNTKRGEEIEAEIMTLTGHPSLSHLEVLMAEQNRET